MFFLVCYDIVEDRARTKVSNLLQGYGLRVQKSVFECVLTDAEYDLLYRRLLKYIEPKEDQVRFYPMSAHCRHKVVVMGLQPSQRVDDASFIV